MFELAGEQYLSSRDAAKRLGITPGTLRKYRTDGRVHVPFTKLSGSVLYKTSDVEAYMSMRPA